MELIVVVMSSRLHSFLLNIHQDLRLLVMSSRRGVVFRHKKRGSHGFQPVDVHGKAEESSPPSWPTASTPNGFATTTQALPVQSVVGLSFVPAFIKAAVHMPVCHEPTGSIKLPLASQFSSQYAESPAPPAPTPPYSGDSTTFVKGTSENQVVDRGSGSTVHIRDIQLFDSQLSSSLPGDHGVSSSGSSSGVNSVASTEPVIEAQGHRSDTDTIGNALFQDEIPTAWVSREPTSNPKSATKKASPLFPADNIGPQQRQDNARQDHPNPLTKYPFNEPRSLPEIGNHQTAQSQRSSITQALQPKGYFQASRTFPSVQPTITVEYGTIVMRGGFYQSKPDLEQPPQETFDEELRRIQVRKDYLAALEDIRADLRKKGAL